MPRRPPVPVSAQISAACLTAAGIGLFEAAMTAMTVAGFRGGIEYVPPRIWIVAPVVWMLLAVVTCGLVLPWTRTRGGLYVPAILIATFLILRLRTHAVVMAAALAGSGAVLALASRWMLRWMSRPRTPIAAGVLAAAGIAALAAAAPLPRRAPATRTGTADGPNVILVFLDTVRYDAVFGTDGRVRPQLPTLARLSAESTTFSRAYSTSAWTLPAHLSAVTGLEAHQLGVSFDAQTYTRPDLTLAERFRQRGYRTAAVISNSFLNAGSGFQRGFETFDHAQTSLDLCRTAPASLGDLYWPWFTASVCNWAGSKVTRHALGLMDDTGGPFFLALNYMDAHEPYYVERSCGEASGYAAAIRCLDRHLAPVVDWRSSRRPTILAVVGDHGEQFGEHGLQRHGNSLYVQLLHVPLIVRMPGAAGPRNRPEPISIAALRSLLDQPFAAPAGEAPMLAVLHPPAATGQPSEWSATDGRWHLIARDGAPDRLFYLPSDPDEERDVSATDPRSPDTVRLRAAIADVRRAPRPDLRKFRSLGYIH